MQIVVGQVRSDVGAKPLKPIKHQAQTVVPAA